MTDPTTAPTKPRLSAEGQVYVTLAAARTFMEQMPGGSGDIEAARRELTEIMLDAYRTDTDGRCRARIKSLGLDLSARVVVEGRLIVVTSVHCRDLTSGGRGGDRAAQNERRAERGLAVSFEDREARRRIVSTDKKRNT